MRERERERERERVRGRDSDRERLCQRVGEHLVSIQLSDRTVYERDKQMFGVKITVEQ